MLQVIELRKTILFLCLRTLTLSFYGPGTTIGYGDISPKSDAGKIAAALYAILAVNVIASLLEPAKDYLLSFCLVPAPTKVATASRKKKKKQSKTSKKKNAGGNSKANGNKETDEDEGEGDKDAQESKKKK